MSKPLFSIVAIVKNEAKTLPRLFSSLEEFKRRGGDVFILDTGSTDNTAQIARNWGCTVFEVGKKFVRIVDKDTANKINRKFLVGQEANIVEGGHELFDFGAARNHIAEKATSNMICTLDGDEAYSTFNIDVLDEVIRQGVDQLEYSFVYAHTPSGAPAVQFIQSKFYNKEKINWRGLVHEVLSVVSKDAPNVKRVGEDAILLEHWQEPGKDHRGNYLVGLALDCYLNPHSDRQSHYFARELMWSGRYKSAIKEFERHITMNGWPVEKAQSFIFIGDCYGHLNKPEEQYTYYHKAFYVDSGRREALIALASFMRHQNNPLATAAYASAALQIPWSDYYANNKSFYEDVPHALLYWAKGWVGNIPEAKEHLLKALEFQPYHPEYLRDTKYYFDYGAPDIQGWMLFKELMFLYTLGKKYFKILEVGSWKGRSTHALLTGCKDGTVTSVDTWKGSDDTRDATNWMAKQEDVFAEFQKNVGHFPNLIVHRGASPGAAADFEDQSFDMIFIDAGHTKDDVAKDIAAWLPKVKGSGMLCGHDYQRDIWMGVCEAVDEVFGKPDGVEGTIWWVDLSNRILESKPERVRGFVDVEDLPASDEGQVERKDSVGEPETEGSLIPKTIYTCWFSDDGKIPEDIQKYIDSQRIYGYEHKVLTLKDLISVKHTEYMRQCFQSEHGNKRFVKLTDYLRMRFLYEFGGIFLDADVEVLPGKTFDKLLTSSFFVGKETQDAHRGTIVLGTAVLGSVAGHPLLKEWIETVERDFRGDDNLCYESSMDILNKIGVKYQDQMTIVEPDVFYPYDHVMDTNNFTENTICVHRYIKTWTENPLITRFKQDIEAGVNFTFVKRGDGEMACMNGAEGANCDGHRYSRELGVRLQSAYKALEGRAKIVDFDNQAEYNALLHRTDNKPKLVSDFYKAIKKCGRHTILIGPRKIRPMRFILGVSEYLIITENNVFDEYDTVLAAIPVVENAIYLFCAGMPAKLMIADLMDRNPNATYLDCGSAFDPIAGQSRTFQISTEEFRSLYNAEVLLGGAGGESLVKSLEWGPEFVEQATSNFDIPQERHPERLFVLDEIWESDEVVYDFGCGSHKTLDRAIGCDIRPVTDVEMDIENCVNIGSDVADVIISRHSFEHLKNPIKTLREWARLLKPTGKLIFVLPDHEKINTVDPYYSNNEHLHAYTEETLKDLLSVFPNLYIEKSQKVIEDWSFGVVVRKLPTVKILIPTLGRPEGLAMCLESIEWLTYPRHLITVEVLEGDDTVPEKVWQGAYGTKEDLIVYAANDMTFEPKSLLRAVLQTKFADLVAFGGSELLPDKGNICEHFVIKTAFVRDVLDWEIFDRRFHHVGCDNLLWAKTVKLGTAHRATDALVNHRHFSKGFDMDDVYARGWGHVEEDRKLLAEELASL